MSICKENIVDVELTNGAIFRSYNNKTIGEGDINGNKYGARLYENGQQVSLYGTSCIGYFIRPDGITLIINGTTDNNVALVELPQAAYAVEGDFSLAIKVNGNGISGTVRIVDGTVVNTTTGDIADPAQELPSISDYEALAEETQEAAEEIGKIHIDASQISGTRYKIAVSIDD